MKHDKCAKCGKHDGEWYMARGMCKRCYANWYYWNKPGEREKNKKRALGWSNSHKEYLLDYYRNLKRKVLEHYSNGELKCACCGESTFEFLTLDHIDGGGRQHRKKVGTGRWFYTWVVTHNYPEIFQVLCMNCNFAKGVHGKCPHENKIT